MINSSKLNTTCTVYEDDRRNQKCPLLSIYLNSISLLLGSKFYILLCLFMYKTCTKNSKCTGACSLRTQTYFRLSLLIFRGEKRQPEIRLRSQAKVPVHASSITKTIKRDTVSKEDFINGVKCLNYLEKKFKLSLNFLVIYKADEIHKNATGKS